MIRLITLLLACTFIAHGETSTIKDITPEQVALIMKGQMAPIIIDIRTPEEFSKGHLEGAKLINYRKDFEKNLAKLDRDKRYVFHCQSGGRSTQSLPVWKKLGFKKVTHLKSGYLGWQKAKLPVVIPKK